MTKLTSLELFWFVTLIRGVGDVRTRFLVIMV